MNRWTIHIRKFGKVEKADIEISPLTLFVGDNNSGKSYVMTLLYGLLNVRFFFDGYDFDKESHVYQNCCEILDRMLQTDSVNEFVLRGEELTKFEDLINKILKKNISRFLRNLFNKEMHVEELWVTFPPKSELVFKVCKRMDGDTRKKNITLNLKMAANFTQLGYRIREDELQESENGYPFLLSYIMQSMLYSGFGRSKTAKRVYLPTTRTGFLLTYKTLVGSAVQDKFTMEETTKNLLTRPNSDFLRELSSMSVNSENPQFEDEIKFIEDCVIAGQVGVSDTQNPDYFYTPLGSDKKLPLHITSGVVTEMTPLLLFLKYTELGALMIEEPEISLHPQLQRQIARILIRLVNKGLPVFATTHSDIIVQHVNNMIKLSEAGQRDALLKKSDYKQSDLLPRDHIKVYQFDVEQGRRTCVHKLPCGDYGFEVMTFYNTLKQLNDEIDWIENEE